MYYFLSLLFSSFTSSSFLHSHVFFSFILSSPFLRASIQGYHNGLAHTVSGSGDYNADISRYLLEQGAYANMLGSSSAGIIHVSHLKYMMINDKK